MTRAVDIIRQAAPRAKPGYLAACEAGDTLLQQNGIVTPDRFAQFFAQVLHETGGLTLDRESMNYSAERLLEVFGVGVHSAAITPDEAQRLARNETAIAERVYGLGNPKKATELGNTQPGDGFKYRGGGLLQTTGRANYRTMGLKCGIDFEKQPDLVVSAQFALLPALAEWTANNLNVLADSNDFLAISRAINLGNPKSTRTPNGLADRANWLAKIRPLADDFHLTNEGISHAAVLPGDGTAPIKIDLTGGVAAAIGDKVLRIGAQGDAIRAVQLALAKLGYALTGTGNFGGATETAVTDFQQRHNIEADGEVGAETARAIDRALAHPDAPVPPPQQPDKPLWLVEGLKWIGTDESQGDDDNPKIIAWAQQEGGNIARDYNHDSIPWCALFANMILTKVGLKGTETLWALDWDNWGVKLPGPAVGAIAPK
jgi:putative chitinase